VGRGRTPFPLIDSLEGTQAVAGESGGGRKGPEGPRQGPRIRGDGRTGCEEIKGETWGEEEKGERVQKPSPFGTNKRGV